MYLGRIVETAPRDELYSYPMHPYTEALLSAVPLPDPSQRKERIILKGDIPSSITPPRGCIFSGRCPIVDQKTCLERHPPLEEKRKGHWAACYLRQ
jgi:oligopeptide/dipeptide ABC transporter ATP-binding protein